MKIAIIGSGISGLSAAYLLYPQHEITVYEKNATLGGHSRTVEVPMAQGSVAVDTGFIVFNKRNYPLLTGLFEHLKVPVVASNMSFGASIAGGWLEYGSVGIASLLAQKRNLFRPQYWGMLRDILKFNRQAMRYADSTLTLGECLDAMKMGAWFREYYLLAMGGAIWSMPLQEMLNFPASTFIRFFDNHGLLTVSDQPQWYTVKGGSREYVQRLTAGFIQHIRLNCGVQQVQRDNEGVTVLDERGESLRYDAIIFACHPDQALHMLAQPSAAEQEVIGSFRYQPNTVILHTDTGFMPKRRAAWASWVYLSEARTDNTPAVSLSYWMNNLQPLTTQAPVIVTLNPGRRPAEQHILDEHVFEHPVFDRRAIAAQRQMESLQGQNRSWYCGAWLRYGFHEDGLMSAVAMAAKLGITPPWK